MNSYSENFEKSKATLLEHHFGKFVDAFDTLDNAANYAVSGNPYLPVSTAVTVNQLYPVSGEMGATKIFLKFNSYAEILKN